MEGKYGRLFTEADLARAVDLAHRQGYEDGYDAGSVAWPGREEKPAPPSFDALVELADGGFPTFPADEPLFLLRGQDVAAPFAIASAQPKSTGIDYAQSCLNAGAPESHLRAVWEAAAAMRDWQAANPARVKVPD